MKAHRTSHLWFAVTLSAFLIGGTQASFAKGDKPPEPTVRKMTENQTRAKQRTHKLREVQGTVIDTKTVQLRGSAQRNLVALIKTKKAKKNLPVDLGPAKQVPRRAIRSGAEIAVEGQVEVIRGKQFMVAKRFKAKGMQARAVDRSQQKQQFERNYSTARRPMKQNQQRPRMR